MLQGWEDPKQSQVSRYTQSLNEIMSAKAAIGDLRSEDLASGAPAEERVATRRLSRRCERAINTSRKTDSATGTTAPAGRRRAFHGEVRHAAYTGTGTSGGSSIPGVLGGCHQLGRLHFQNQDCRYPGRLGSLPTGNHQARTGVRRRGIGTATKRRASSTKLEADPFPRACFWTSTFDSSHSNLRSRKKKFI